MKEKTIAIFFFVRFDRPDFSQLPENIKNYVEKVQEENNRYRTEIDGLQTQLNNLTAVVDFADSTKIAEIADLKQRHQQELDTIQILLDGFLKKKKNFLFRFDKKNIFLLVSFCRIETVRDRVNDFRAKFETDLNNLRRKCEILQQENYEFKVRAVEEK